MKYELPKKYYTRRNYLVFFYYLLLIIIFWQVIKAFKEGNLFFLSCLFFIVYPIVIILFGVFNIWQETKEKLALKNYGNLLIENSKYLEIENLNPILFSEKFEIFISKIANSSDSPTIFILNRYIYYFKLYFINEGSIGSVWLGMKKYHSFNKFPVLFRKLGTCLSDNEKENAFIVAGELLALFYEIFYLYVNKNPKKYSDSEFITDCNDLSTLFRQYDHPGIFRQLKSMESKMKNLDITEEDSLVWKILIFHWIHAILGNHLDYLIEISPYSEYPRQNVDIYMNTKKFREMPSVINSVVLNFINSDFDSLIDTIIISVRNFL